MAGELAGSIASRARVKLAGFDFMVTGKLTSGWK
jgi:hypothetical protein